MSEVESTPPRCLWCRFQPDTRKVFFFFFVLAALIAAAKGVEDPSLKSARARKKQIHVVPMATTPDKRSKAMEGPLPLLIEKEFPQ